MERGSIERGEVIKAEPEGYTLTSLDREGITTPPLKTLENESYEVGDKVHFFYFKDGDGRIICKL